MDKQTKINTVLHQVFDGKTVRVVSTCDRCEHRLADQFPVYYGVAAGRAKRPYHTCIEGAGE